MNNPRIPWANIWTLVVSATGILILINGITSRANPMLTVETCWLALSILACACLAAAWQLHRATLVDDEGHHIHNIQDPGRFYVRALKLLSSHKWLLGLFTIIAILNIAGVVSDAFIRHLLRPDKVAFQLSHPIPINAYLQSLPLWIRSVCSYTPTNLFPSMCLNPARGMILGVVFPIFTLGVILFSMRRAIPSEPVSRRSFMAILYLIVLCTLASTALDGYQMRQFARQRPTLFATVPQRNSPQARSLTKTAFSSPAVSKSPIGPQRPGQFTGKRGVNPFTLMGISSLLWHPAVSVLLAALMMGGIFGTLKRGGDGEQTAVATFVEDAWQYFKPLSVIYLFAWLFNPREFIYPFLESYQGMMIGVHFFDSLRSFMETLSPAAYLLLMISPCIAVLSNSRGWESVKAGAKLWITKYTDIVPFAALSITLYLAIPTTTNLLLTLVTHQSSAFSPAGIVALAVSRLILTSLAIVTTLAVWELARELLSTAEPPRTD